jgi:hypothetical protein
MQIEAGRGGFAKLCHLSWMSQGQDIDLRAVMAGPGYRVDPRPTDVIHGVALGKLLSERKILLDQSGSVT